MIFYAPLRIFNLYRPSHWRLILGILIFIYPCSTVSISMKGQKANFDVTSKYGTLCEGVHMPELTELTVCIDIYLTHNTNTWAAFTYHIAASGGDQELGIGSQDHKLRVWFSGTIKETQIFMPLNVWNTACFTWSNSSKVLTVYLNGSEQYTSNMTGSSVNSGGSLVLGQYQLSQPNTSKIEFHKSWSFFGELYYFRVWDYVKSSLELSQLHCSDGDLISWSTKHLNFTSNTLGNDPTLRCNLFTSPTTSERTTSTPITSERTTSTPITSERTTSTPTTSERTTSTPTTSERTTSTPITSERTTSTPTTSERTTSTPTTSERTTSTPTTSERTASSPTTSERTTSTPTTSERTTSTPTTSEKTTSTPTTSERTTSTPTTSERTTSTPTTSERTTSTPTTSERTTSTPTTSERTTSTPTTSERTTSMPTTSERTTSSPSSESSTPSELHETSIIVPSSSSSPVSSAKQVNFFKTMMTTIVSVVRGAALTNIDIWDLTNCWLKSIFNTDIVLLDINLSQTKQRQNTRSGIIIKTGEDHRKILSSDRYSCVFRLQAISTKAESQIRKEIKERLIHDNYTDSTVTLAADPLSIRLYRFEPGLCRNESTLTEVGQYTWPSTMPLRTVRLECIKKPNHRAQRECKLSDFKDQAEWSKPNVEQCKIVPTLPDSIPGLDLVAITTDNADDVAQHILLLTTNTCCLSRNDLEIVISKTTDIVKIAAINLPLGKDVVGIVNNILNKTDNLIGFSARILDIMEIVGNKLEFQGSEIEIITETVSMALVNVNFIHFWGIAFGVMSYINGFSQQIYRNVTSLDDPVAYIELPPVLPKLSSGKKTLNTRIQFQFYGETSLFEDRSFNGQILNSYVVSSSIEGKDIKNLSDPVKVTLQHLTPKEGDESVTCVFWDFQQNSGAGGWNSSGCEVTKSSSKYTTCYCNHLTHFGILLDVSRHRIDPVNLWILTIITYIGCGVSSFFLGIILLTYLSFENLRCDYPSKILLNLCMSLFMLNIVFLTDSWLASFNSSGLCISVAAALHYFLLTSFTWMCIEAIHMYFALVKVFNIYIRHYILKFCLIGWGFPAIVVGTLLSIDVDVYGYETNMKAANPVDMFCWLRNETTFYISVVAYFGLVFLVNLSMFIVVLSQIQAVRTKRHSSNTHNMLLHHLKSSASLTILLGLTWGFAFFAWGPAKVTFMYLFSIFNTLQGFFIFVFYCLMKENVRTQWRIHLCCGRFKLNQYSDWSRTGTIAKLKDGRTGSLAHSNNSSKSNTTITSSNGSRINLISPQNFGNGISQIGPFSTNYPDPDYSKDYNWSLTSA
ncbi:adhesion G-protein coupled receptor G4-like [Heterodontus francisci]|uniref:adhesion G-protein coupled receptor G4-like n=1 Tax=Heterodontus francisci TaxID=7792 RepID=UPI00355C2445